jgi:hypothetical protein
MVGGPAPTANTIVMIWSPIRRRYFGRRTVESVGFLAWVQPTSFPVFQPVTMLTPGVSNVLHMHGNHISRPRTAGCVAPLPRTAEDVGAADVRAARRLAWGLHRAAGSSSLDGGSRVRNSLHS